MKQIILIGGAPTAGKSTLARKLAGDLQFPWISTDTIREQMRKLVRREDYPALFQHADATAEMGVEFLNHNTAEKIVHHQNTESLDVQKGVRALIETDYVWDSFIIEGIAILPAFAREMMSAHTGIQTVFLIDENQERIRDAIFTRGLWDDADKYPDAVKEKEVRWVLAFNQRLIEEAARYGLPVVKIGDRDACLEEIKRMLKSGT
ncbi:MAG: AAA family ATPase [Candidatus Sungbacteria bacterium]|nr:AAA family ATPase [Candidatus Sungbacteria bacterium]